MKPDLAQGRPDDFQTPSEALDPLLPYLKKDLVIWEPACGKENLSNRLKELGYEVVATDILDGHNFLTWKPERFDVVVTNPPYSIKGEFLARCYQLGKPFALLLPLTILETKKRQLLFRKYGVELILFDKRINFATPSGEGSGSWFATMWVTNGLGLGKELNFVGFQEKKQLEMFDEGD